MVELPGEVEAFAVTWDATLRRVLADPRFVKNIGHWLAWSEGRIPRDWELASWVVPENMLTADGDHHRRLRGLVSQAFTPGRIEALAPRIIQIVDQLLDQMGSLNGRHVDLKAALALPLPLTVISELFGVAERDRAPLQELCAAVFDQSLTRSQAAAAQRGLQQSLAKLVAHKRTVPGEDMTSALIAACDGTDQLDESELIWTLALMIGAGYETTMNLILNAVHALLTHPRQLALVLTGHYGWDAVVEETLRWDPSIANLPFRYTREEVHLEGVVIPAGSAVLMCYGAAGRDPARHGATAHRFDLHRDDASSHLAFSHGAHYCLGAPLARLEARLVLQRLFTRFPRLRLAAPASALVAMPSLIANGFSELPVTASPSPLTPRYGENGRVEEDVPPEGQRSA